jgi:hypothetical protein
MMGEAKVSQDGFDMPLTRKWLDQLRAAIDWAGGDEIPEGHRKIIQRALEQSLLDAMEYVDRQEILANEGAPWKPQEIDALKRSLDRLDPPRDWTQEQNNRKIIQARFKRSEKGIRRKAAELGLADRIDYWLSKSVHGFE